MAKLYIYRRGPTAVTHGGYSSARGCAVVAGFSTARSKFLSIVRRARMVSSGDDGVYTGSGDPPAEFFFTFSPQFCKNKWSIQKIVKLYIYRRGPGVVAHGGSYAHGCNVATATTVATSVFKNLYIFCLNSDGGKLYM
jgi:hypothetical protein